MPNMFSPGLADAALEVLRVRVRTIVSAESDPLLRAEDFLERVSSSGRRGGERDQALGDGSDDAIPDSELYELPDAWAWAGRIQAAPAMTRDRQVSCALEIEAGVIAHAVLGDEWAAPVPASVGELQALVVVGEAAFEEMYRGNLRLVLHWARITSRGNLEAMQDNFQEGCFGLHRAIQGWDGLRGYTFSTYAIWHIRQSIDRGRGNFGYLIRIPIHVQDAWGLHDRNGEPLTDNAAHARELIGGLVSWDVMTDDPVFDCASRLAPVLEEEVIDQCQRQEDVRFCAGQLTDRERVILRERFGFGCDPRTLDDIGVSFGLTRERIRQIEFKALVKLQIAWLFASVSAQSVYGRDVFPENDDVRAFLLAIGWARPTLKDVARAVGLPEKATLEVMARLLSGMDRGNMHR